VEVKDNHMITAIDKKAALVVIDLQDGIVKMKLAHPGTEIVRQSARLVAAARSAGVPVIVVNVIPFGAPSGKVRTQAPGLPREEAAQQQAKQAMEAGGFFAIVPELGAGPIFPRIGEVDTTDVIVGHLSGKN
jgi:nicotinamidase-related amidase